ncbi:MAG: ATP-binding cassette domain-containing protein [Deltaproteobacteria bacterium]|nr:ATP-binding cassette domain-containing protein [Deltaproteobacteria bacterium]
MQFGTTSVHKDITFTINQGEVVTLLGPSGTGKTVILKLIIGLLFPTSGKIFVFNKPLHGMNERELIQLRSHIGMLFQGAALFDSLTIFENVAYSLRERGRYGETQITDIVRETLSIVGLPGIEGKLPPALSGGQKKRVGLARALASSPKVMLFDEPTTGLDPSATRMIGDLIIKLRDQFNITSIVVTHDIETAKRISDRWILINEGSVLAEGAVSELASSNNQVIEFISGEWFD